MWGRPLCLPREIIRTNYLRRGKIYRRVAEKICLSQTDKTVHVGKMYYVYVLQSKKDKNIYIGFTRDLLRRFKKHNLGKVKSTKSRKPFILVYYEAYKEKKDATKREIHLKTRQQRELLKKKLKYSLEKKA